MTSQLCVSNNSSLHTLHHSLDHFLLSVHKPLLGTGCSYEFGLFGPMDNVPYVFLDWVPVARTSLFYSDLWTMSVVFFLTTVDFILLANKGTFKNHRGIQYVFN